MHQMDFIAQEVSRLETAGRKIEEQVRYFFSEKKTLNTLQNLY